MPRKLTTLVVFIATTMLVFLGLLAVSQALVGHWVTFSFLLLEFALYAFFFHFIYRSFRHGNRSARKGHRSGSSLGASSPVNSASVPGASARANARVMADESLLPREKTEEPIIAWKLARMYIGAATQAPILTGVHVPLRHPIEGEAICGRENNPLRETLLCELKRERRLPTSAEIRTLHRFAEHSEMPALSCNCGYYAWKTAALMQQYHHDHNNGGLWGQLVGMQVELSGKVLQFQNGYRAERQRVLGLYVGASCFHCGAHVSDVPFTAGVLTVLCTPCHGFIQNREDVLAFDNGFKRRMSYGAVASALGCEVSGAIPLSLLTGAEPNCG